MPTIKIKEIIFDRERIEGMFGYIGVGADADVAKIDGCVMYEVNDADGTEYPNTWPRQPFSKSGSFQIGGKIDNHHNVWAWNGNKEAPSLTPSFLCEWNRSFRPPNSPNYVVHIYLVDGKIVNSGGNVTP